MEMHSENEEFDHFVERMAKIRELSSPVIYEVDDAEFYSQRLRENFQTIGQLAAENREMLDHILYPILGSDTAISEEDIEKMSEFSEKLLSMTEDVTDFANLDLPIVSMVSERLMQDAEEKHELDNLILRMDAAYTAFYSMMNMTERVTPDPDIHLEFKKKGEKIGNWFVGLLDKDKFLKIEDEELRGLVLTNARFLSAFSERTTDPEENEWTLDFLDQMKKIPDDPFYVEAMPGFDWKYYRFRMLEYYLQCTDIGNARGFTQKQMERILVAADEMEELIQSDPEYFAQLNGQESIPFELARNRFLAGKMTGHEYKKILLDTYEARNREDFRADGNFANVLIPVELLCLLKNRKRNVKDMALMKRLYQNLSAYMFNMPNAGSLSFMMEYFSEAVRRFIEVPSGISFEEFGLQALAAMHPPTYVHSKMVGQITECLCMYLIEIKPEILIGVMDTKTVEEVKEKRDTILSFAFHAALCHDFGKIPIIDTIFVYGRRLLDLEFNIIKAHPKIGYELLSSHESTRIYAEVALGHHRFHDDSKGYPEDFKSCESKDKPIIDLVLCADCLDAATDTVGRSYNRGKTLEDYIEELKEGAGTRYAAWILELFEDEDLKMDVNYLLTTARQGNYRDTFLLLKSVKEKEKK